MEINFPKVSRLNLRIAPVDWELACRNCGKILVNYAQKML